MGMGREGPAGGLHRNLPARRRGLRRPRPAGARPGLFRRAEGQEPGRHPRLPLRLRRFRCRSRAPGPRLEHEAGGQPQLQHRHGAGRPRRHGGGDRFLPVDLSGPHPRGAARPAGVGAARPGLPPPRAGAARRPHRRRHPRRTAAAAGQGRHPAGAVEARRHRALRSLIARPSGMW
ncbi:hypothetical protein MTBUT4_710006 [Magnetospirillum sp. UT-4]|nr:hypothetical protein MTBUT4_710006 [Magnetospirillum sp. UT-4]